MATGSPDQVKESCNLYFLFPVEVGPTGVYILTESFLPFNPTVGTLLDLEFLGLPTLLLSMLGRSVGVSGVVIG